MAAPVATVAGSLTVAGWRRRRGPRPGAAAGGASAPSAGAARCARSLALVTRTVGVCLRYRVTGLAAEAGFFALLSMPPLVLGLAGSAAWIGSRLGTDTALQLKNGLREYLSPFLTDDVVNTVIVPTLEDALDRPRYDLISIGFVLSLWSGSRALNVYLDTISIMYGLGGHRSIVRTRLLSFSIYLLVLVLGAVTLPLVLVGPTLIGRALPAQVDWLLVAYWPLVTLLGVALLTTLYHVSVPLRTSWRRDVPGALLALVIWVLASALLRAALAVAVPGTGHADGEPVDLRPAHHADRRAGLALPARHRRADRGRAQRRGRRDLAQRRAVGRPPGGRPAHERAGGHAHAGARRRGRAGPAGAVDPPVRAGRGRRAHARAVGPRRATGPDDEPARKSA